MQGGQSIVCCKRAVSKGVPCRRVLRFAARAAPTLLGRCTGEHFNIASFQLLTKHFFDIYLAVPNHLPLTPHALSPLSGPRKPNRPPSRQVQSLPRPAPNRRALSRLLPSRHARNLSPCGHRHVLARRSAMLRWTKMTTARLARRLHRNPSRNTLSPRRRIQRSGSRQMYAPDTLYRRTADISMCLGFGRGWTTAGHSQA